MAVIARFAWAFGLAGGLAWLGAASAWYLLGETSGPATSLGLLGTVLLVAWAGLDAKNLATAAGTRRARLSAGSFSLQAAALAMAVLFYAVIDERFDRTYDLTDRGSHSLSSQTVSVVEGIDAPVQLLAFFEEGTQEALAFSRLVQLYTERSDALQLEWIDLLENPVRARQEGITGPTVILRQDGREQRLEVDFSETNLTQRLVLVQTDVTHTICWSSGHGEADPDEDIDPTGYGAAVITLEGLNYQVLRTNIAGQGIPPECEVLVVARPQRDFLPWEREAVAAHLGAGRHGIVLIDPLVNTPELNAELARYGVQVFDDVVFDGDPSRVLADMQGTLAIHDDGVLAHPITRALAGAVVLPVVRSLGVEVRDGLLAQELLRTSTLGWGETDLEDPVVEPNEGVDRTGQLPLALVVEVVDPNALDVVLPEDGPTDPDAGLGGLEQNPGRLVPTDWAPEPGGRLVVVGDADFPSNQALVLGSNQDFLLNTFAWLVGEEEQLGERPELGEPLDLSGFGSALLCLVSLVFVPGLAMAFAAFALLRRGWLSRAAE